MRRLFKGCNADFGNIPYCVSTMARQEGLEPPAYCLEGSCSIQLSYWRIRISTLKCVAQSRFFLERVMGIEPTCSAWKADILPLNYTRGSPATVILYRMGMGLSSCFSQNLRKFFVGKNRAEKALRPCCQMVSMCSSPLSAVTCAPRSGRSQAAMMCSARPFSISFSIRRRRLRAPKVREYDFLTR